MKRRKALSHARFWDDVYTSQDAYSAVIRLRQATALRWADELASLAPGAPVLEVGCGAGHLAEALARRGLSVTAMDRAPYMAEMAQQRLAAFDRGGLALQGDAETLPFPDRRFELVIALGLIGWLPHPAQFIHEAQRVLKPGGHLIVSAANSHGLTNLLDPLTNPMLAGACQQVLTFAKAHVGKRFSSGWPDDPRARLHSAPEVGGMLTAAGLSLLRWTTLGFGPFSVFSHVAPPDAVGLRIHQALQRRANRGAGALRRLGSQHLFLAHNAAPFRAPAQER